MDESHARMTWWGEISERFASTPFRTFVVWPAVVALFELWQEGASFSILPFGFLFLMWGYAQYRFVGNYRLKIAGGGPGLSGAPPDQLVTTGPYSITRNPMYLGHLIFIYGLSLTFKSWFALVILSGHMIWFHHRVLGDEEKLRGIFGRDYDDYAARVQRWIPGLF